MSAISACYKQRLSSSILIYSSPSSTLSSFGPSFLRLLPQLSGENQKKTSLTEFITGAHSLDIGRLTPAEVPTGESLPGERR